MPQFNSLVICCARLLSAGIKQIDDIKETDRVNVYVYAIQNYNYQPENVDPRYTEAVNVYIS